MSASTPTINPSEEKATVATWFIGVSVSHSVRARVRARRISAVTRRHPAPSPLLSVSERSAPVNVTFGPPGTPGTPGPARAPGAVTGPFRHAEIPRPRSWVGRLLRVRHPNAVRVEIQNLLAARPLPEVTRGDVDAILTRHRVDLSRRRDVVLRLWRQALRQFLRDDTLSDNEVEYLAKLRPLFALTDRDVERAHSRSPKRRYAEAFSEASPTRS